MIYAHDANQDGVGCITDISLQKQAQEDAQNQVKLSEQLGESQNKFRLLAELAPCGIYYMDNEGTLTWANRQWYELTGHSKDPKDHYPKSFLNTVEPEDHSLSVSKFEELAIHKKQVHFELRFKKKWISPVEGIPGQDHTWNLCMAIPELDSDGNVKNIMGVNADITQLKYTEALQARSRIQAEEAKRSQEKFMDITSHEMRNPLSAILQSSDSIFSSVAEIRSLIKDQAAFEIVQSIAESNQIIFLCAQHQGRIINDVLTLSKLDSGMLAVAPGPIQPVEVIKLTMKMFEGELEAHGFESALLRDKSYDENSIDWVMADSSRVRQVS